MVKANEVNTKLILAAASGETQQPKLLRSIEE
jgi:hypothetical protein